MTAICPGCGMKQSENEYTKQEYEYCDGCDNWVCEECSCECMNDREIGVFNQIRSDFEKNLSYTLCENNDLEHCGF